MVDSTFQGMGTSCSKVLHLTCRPLLWLRKGSSMQNHALSQGQASFLCISLVAQENDVIGCNMRIQ